MSSKYRFRIETDTATETMTPYYDDKLSKEFERNTGDFYYREKLNGSITFLRDDFDTIDAAAFDHEFIVHIDKLVSGSYSNDWWKGYFTKTDGTWDEDNKTLTVQPQPYDRYKDLIHGIDKEFDLIKLAPNTNQVNIELQPLFQVYIKGADTVTNIVADTYFDQPISFAITNETELTTTHSFTKNNKEVFIPGLAASGGTLSPDISGDYDSTSFERDDGRYKLITVGYNSGSSVLDDTDGDAESVFTITSSTLHDYDDFRSVWSYGGATFEFIGTYELSGTFHVFRLLTGSDPSVGATGTLTHVSGATNTGDQTFTDFNPISGYIRMGIKDIDPPSGPDIFVYISEWFDGSSELDHNNTSIIFTSLTSSSVSNMFVTTFFMRVLTDEATFDGNATTNILTTDPFTNASRYTKTVGVTYTGFLAKDENQTAATIYGLFDENAAIFSGKYFVRPTSPGVSNCIPLTRSEWTGASYWFYYDSALRTLQTDGGTTYTLKHAFKLVDCFKALLTEIDSTITHLEDSNHSDFLYGASNTIKGTRTYPLISPKSNAIVGEYDRPAQKGKIRLKDLLEFVKDFYNAGWYIDSSNRLVIEHVEYFESGLSYGADNIGSDLTTTIEPKTGKNWSYRDKKYSYEKAEMPEQIKHRWMDEVSEPFEGFDINILSKYVQKGSFKEKNLSKFTSDIDMIHANPDQINNDGFFFAEATLDGDGNLELPFSTVAGYLLQNCYAAIVYAHSQYWKYNLPASSVNLNGTDITASSVVRLKIQEVEYPSIEPDPMQLVTTSLGNGRVTKMSINLLSDFVTITLAHDTE